MLLNNPLPADQPKLGVMLNMDNRANVPINVKLNGQWHTGSAEKFCAFVRAERERQEPEPKQPLQRRFALACRILADGTGLCPQNIFETGWEECVGEVEKCGDHDMWKCWQKFINETVESERVCRVCGCTENNACIGRDDAQDCCSWIEEDLCSACATDPEGEKKNET